MAEEYGPQLIVLEYNIGATFANNVFGNYGLNGTPWGVFNGSFKISGGSDSTYAQYKERIANLLAQQSSLPSLMSLRGSVANVKSEIAVDAVLTNLSAISLMNASLYAVAYESVVDADGIKHNMVRGITPTIPIASLGAGESVSIRLQSSLAYNNYYGVVVILKSNTGQIIQAYPAR